MRWVLLGLCVPITLSANAGTPLMWAGILHLTLGNLMIGLLEGGLLIYWLGLRQWFFLVCTWRHDRGQLCFLLGGVSDFDCRKTLGAIDHFVVVKTLFSRLFGRQFFAEPSD